MKMKKLAVITTHPIQYYAPVFKALAESQEVLVKVFYTWGEDSVKKFDPGFQREIEWDIPVLEGYDYTFLKNTSSRPGTNHFFGIINPDAIHVLDKFNPDIVLVYGWSWYSHLQIIRHFSRKKVLWFRGDSTLLDNQGGIKSGIKKVWLRWIYGKITGAFYVGEANKQYFLKYGVSKEKLVFAPHAIDNERFFQERQAEANTLRTNLGVPETGIIVLFAGKLEPKKNPLLLLQVFLDLNLENVYLLIVGNGVLEEEIKKTAVASAKNTEIKFLSFQNQHQMPVIYQASQIYCLPSEGPGETWGLAVNEAMAAGKAVIISDKVGCAQNLVEEGINGFVFKSGDVDDFSNKLKQAVSDEIRLKEMGSRSRHIIQPWSFRNQSAAILESIKSS